MCIPCATHDDSRPIKLKNTVLAPISANHRTRKWPCVLLCHVTAMSRRSPYVSWRMFALEGRYAFENILFQPSKDGKEECWCQLVSLSSHIRIMLLVKAAIRRVCNCNFLFLFDSNNRQETVHASQRWVKMFIWWWRTVMCRFKHFWFEIQQTISFIPGPKYVR